MHNGIVVWFNDLRHRLCKSNWNYGGCRNGANSPVRITHFQSYLLGVTFTQYGGSIVCSINIETISLKYDAEVLNIMPPSENEGLEVFYNFTCKKSVAYTAIIVEVNREYSDTIIISAK